jgi:hypothetical protein
MKGVRPLVAVLSILGRGTAVSAFAVTHAKGGSGLVNHSECGIERWAVKTLTDPRASLVKQTPKTSSVAALTRLPAPVAVRHRTRIAGVETTVYRLRVKLVEMKLEADDDVHLVVAGPATGQTMIVEFPSRWLHARGATMGKAEDGRCEDGAAQMRLGE